MHTLDLGAVAKETEGYTAQDLALLVERAVHANATQTGRSAHGDKTSTENYLWIKTSCSVSVVCCITLTLCSSGACLSQRDFVAALNGFTPPSLWGVDLHTPSGVGLERVGGLREVRQQLMDTVLLPAKVS